MMNRLLSTVFIILYLFSITNTAKSQTLYTKHYTINDGLAGNSVYMCHIDNDGYLWVATSSGLSRFDGQHFKNYGYKDGLIKNEVLIVTNDIKNNIWVSSFAPTPSIYSIKRDTVIQCQDSTILSLPKLTIGLVCERFSAKNNITYINGDEYILCLKADSKFKVIKTGWTTRIKSFETENGNVFISDGFDLYRLEDTTLSFFKELNLLPQEITALSYYNGILYAAIDNKLVLYKYHNDEFTYLSSSALPEKINIIHVNKGGVWITFFNKKDCLLSKSHLLEKSFFKIKIAGYVNNFVDDKEGGVWMSTKDNGLFYIPSIDMIHYTNSDGLNSSLIQSLLPISINTLWLGNNVNSAQLVTIKENKIEVNKTVNLKVTNSNNNYILDIQKKNNEMLFLSQSGINILSNDRIRRIKQHTGPYKSMLVVNDSILSIGHRIQLFLNTKTLKVVRNKEKKIGNKIERIYSQVKGEHNNLWFGGLLGLFHVFFNDSFSIQRVKALEGYRINTLSMRKPYLWIGTQNQGLLLGKYDSLQFELIPIKFPKLPSSTIKTIATEGNKVWIGTNNGIIQANFDYEILKVTNSELINHNDGLISPEINQIKVFDGNAFVATGEGLVKLNAYKNRHSNNYTLSNTYIRELNKDGKLYEDDSVSVQYSTFGIEIGYQIAAFRYSDEITFKYLLEGFDKKWNYTQSNKIKYTNIPPDNYVLNIIAYDEHGNSSGTKKITIVITPLFWQTKWFSFLIILLIFIGVVLLIYWYYRYNERKSAIEIKQHRLIAKTKLETLKAQIKPHFIFNSLNALKDYIYHNKNDVAINLVQKFSSFIRKGLELANDDFTTIEEEIAFFTQYLELEKTKCDDCFIYNISSSKNMSNIIIPSLITQPFVENAIIHGVLTTKEKKGELVIKYYLDEDDVVCSIMDNGIGIKQSQLQKKEHYTKAIGTTISKERITYFKAGLGIDINLKIDDISDLSDNRNGTIVTIRILNAANFITHEN